MVINVNCEQLLTQHIPGEQLRAITDSRLSLGAVGMWGYICEVIGNEEFTLEQLQEANPEQNKEDTADYYWELVDAGYIEE